MDRQGQAIFPTSSFRRPTWPFSSSVKNKVPDFSAPAASITTNGGALFRSRFSRAIAALREFASTATTMPRGPTILAIISATTPWMRSNVKDLRARTQPLLLE